jgi:hypothetical protein
MLFAPRINTLSSHLSPFRFAQSVAALFSLVEILKLGYGLHAARFVYERDEER